MNFIVLLVGKSGSGKTSVAFELEDFFKWKVLESYTTRPPREISEAGHIFVSDEEFDRLENLCAMAKFDGYRYCATKEQVDKSDIYIIDPSGVEYFIRAYTGDKLVIPIYLDASDETLYSRMRERGDSWFSAKKRLYHDKRKFAKFAKNAPIRINAERPLVDVVSDVYQIAMNISSIHRIMNKNYNKKHEEE